MSYIVPLSHLAKLVLSVNVAVLPGGRESLRVLYLCNNTLYEWEQTEWECTEWECTEWEAFARQVLLLATWTSTMAKHIVPYKGGKVLVKFNDECREGEIVAESKRMNKEVMQQRKSLTLMP